MAGRQWNDNGGWEPQAPGYDSSFGYGGPSNGGPPNGGHSNGGPPYGGEPYGGHPNGGHPNGGHPYGESPGYDPDPVPGHEEQSSLVRMYAVTGGRTAPRMDLAMEALVSSATSMQLGLSFIREYRAISELCRQVRSVAEISALLRVPLGVVRVLVADMEAEGLVRVYQPQLDAGKPDRDLLERVLSGLRRL